MVADRTLAALVTGSLGLLLAFAVVLSVLKQTHEAHLADRFAASLELLGREDLTSRLSGIYALEHLAFGSATHHHQMVEVLAAYLREHAPTSRPAPDRLPHKPPADIQACLTVLGRRSTDFRQSEPQRLNLAGTDLRGANLAWAFLEGAVLDGAWLQGANLTHAQLDRALLKGAHLERAVLDGASLVEAYLADAHLEGASLVGATLREAYVAGAHVDGARLPAADLRGAFGLTWDQMQVARRDHRTRFPDYLQNPSLPAPAGPDPTGR